MENPSSYFPEKLTGDTKLYKSPFTIPTSYPSDAVGESFYQPPDLVSPRISDIDPNLFMKPIPQEDLDRSYISGINTTNNNINQGRSEYSTRDNDSFSFNYTLKGRKLIPVVNSTDRMNPRIIPQLYNPQSIESKLSPQLAQDPSNPYRTSPIDIYNIQGVLDSDVQTYDGIDRKISFPNAFLEYYDDVSPDKVPRSENINNRFAQVDVPGKPIYLALNALQDKVYPISYKSVGRGYNSVANENYTDIYSSVTPPLSTLGFHNPDPFYFNKEELNLDANNPQFSPSAKDGSSSYGAYAQTNMEILPGYYEEMSELHKENPSMDLSSFKITSSDDNGDPTGELAYKKCVDDYTSLYNANHIGNMSLEQYIKINCDEKSIGGDIIGEAIRPEEMFRAKKPVVSPVMRGPRLFNTVLRDHPQVQSDAAQFQTLRVTDLAVPDSFDGRVAWKDFLVPVRNQGECGSCITLDADISLSDGTTKKFVDIDERDCVLTVNKGNGETSGSEIYNIFIKKENIRVLQLTTINGRTIKATDDHPFLTQRGMVKLGDIKLSDKVYIKPYVEKKVYTNKIYYLSSELFKLKNTKYIGQENESRLDKHLKEAIEIGLFNRLDSVVFQQDDISQYDILSLTKRDIDDLSIDSNKLKILIKMYGFLRTDGSLYFHKDKKYLYCKFYMGLQEDVEEFNNDLEYLGLSKSNASRQDNNVKYSDGHSTTHKGFRISKGGLISSIMAFFGARPGKRVGKESEPINNFIMESEEDIKVEFLNGLFGGDGRKFCISKEKKRGDCVKAPCLYQTNDDKYINSLSLFSEQINALLDDIGIKSYLTKLKQYSESTTYVLHVDETYDNMIKFAQKIDFAYTKTKRESNLKVYEYIKYITHQIDNVKNTRDKVRELFDNGIKKPAISKKLNIELQKVIHHIRSRTRNKTDKISRPRECLSYDDFINSDNDLLLLGIEEIIEIPTEPVKDFTTKSDNHTFIANGFVVSNCWAYSSSETLSDRFAIWTAGQLTINLSAYDMVICQSVIRPGPPYNPSVASTKNQQAHSKVACNGNTIYNALLYTYEYGLVESNCFNQSDFSARGFKLPTDSSVQYPKDLPQCEQVQGKNYDRCLPKSPDSNSKDDQAARYFRTSTGYNVTNPNDPVEKKILSIKQEIYRNGPVAAGFLVYEDFMSFDAANTIYSYDGKSSAEGGHAIEIVGWGQDNSKTAKFSSGAKDMFSDTAIDYWIIRNSWGTSWGRGGFFYIQMGQCNIEDNVVSFIPQLPNLNLSLFPKISNANALVIRNKFAVDDLTFYRTAALALIKNGQLKGYLSPVIKVADLPSYTNFIAATISRKSFGIMGGNKKWFFIIGGLIIIGILLFLYKRRK